MYKSLNSANTVNGAGFVVSNRQFRFFVVFACVLVIAAALTGINIYELHRLTSEHFQKDHEKVIIPEAEGERQNTLPIAWIRGPHQSTGYLKHVHNVFIRLGFEIHETDDNADPPHIWDVLWSFNYPYGDFKKHLTHIKPHQRVNHFPGAGFISNKVSLAVSGLKYIPKAFRMPADKDKLLEFAKKNPEKMFVQKSNNHRGIKIEKIDSLNLEADGSFIQEFMHNPLLVDGYKFDIGVYTIITSINPLRVYIYGGDVLFRFCPDKYHPFDPKITDKYVVGGDYLPTWKVPSLKPFYVDQGFGMKDSFDAWLRENNKDPNKVWEGVNSAIREVLLKKENHIAKALKNYQYKENFFEMMRFDLIIDDDLNVHLMEANMSPNLSSAHFKENRLLYEQVVYNALALVGIARAVHSSSLASRSTDEEEMMVAMKDIQVFPEHCKTNCFDKGTCSKTECQLCKPCLTKKQIILLKRAYLEHTNRRDCRRVVPEAVDVTNAHEPTEMNGLTPENTLMTEWFRGKCLLDNSFCM